MPRFRDRPMHAFLGDTPPAAATTSRPHVVTRPSAGHVTTVPEDLFRAIAPTEHDDEDSEDTEADARAFLSSTAPESPALTTWDVSLPPMREWPSVRDSDWDLSSLPELDAILVETVADPPPRPVTMRPHPITDVKLIPRAISFAE